MGNPEVRTSVSLTQYSKEPREIHLERFGIVTTGREYTYHFYCRGHKIYSSAEVVLPHDISPGDWVDFVDSQINTSKGCAKECRKKLISIEPIYVTTETNRAPRHLIK